MLSTRPSLTSLSLLIMTPRAKVQISSPDTNPVPSLSRTKKRVSHVVIQDEEVLLKLTSLR